MYSRKWRTKRSKGPGGKWGLLAVCALLLTAGRSASLDRVSDLQEHFDKETHAGSKIKVLDKLTEAQFESARKASAGGDYVAAGLILEKYRDNVRDCLLLLKKQEPDAERHSAGYRQLEMEARKGIREVEDTMLTAPPDLRPPFDLVHKDLLDMDDELIRLLFPRRTPEPQKAPRVPEGKP